ncbi:MAG: hypothetical protein ACO3AG_00670 [Fluviibacter sp.]
MAKLSEKGEYRQPKAVPVPNTSGYPNNVANTQTLRIRGTKNTTRGNSCSTKMG